VNPADDRVDTVELGELIPPRRIALTWHADRTPHPSLDTFVRLAARVGAQMERLRAVDAPPSAGRRLAQHSGGLRSVASVAA
jgi:hypothetical protein